METVKKCSRCGLCAQVCPIFEIERNDPTLSRGKFLQLLGVLAGDLKLNKKIKNNLSFCLNCGRCTKNCPSDIDTVSLFAKIKNRKVPFGKAIFNLKILPIKILNLFSRKKFPLKEGEFYFKGCLSGYNNKSPFKCCAIPFFVGGMPDIYNELVEYNLKIIEDENVKKVYFDCATCFAAVKKYPFKNEENKKKLELVVASEANEKFTFFKPCHMENVPEFSSKNYIPLDFDGCCGFGGDFFIKHPIVAHKLSIKLAKKIKETGVKYVISPCPTCAWSILWGSFWVGNRIKIFDSVLFP